MNQQQTNTLFLFLLIAIFQFAGYSILIGSTSGGNNSFAIIAMLLMSGLFAGIYYLISESTKIPIEWSQIQHDFRPSIIKVLKFIFLATFFGLFTIVGLMSWAGPDKIKDVGIAIIGGIISGGLVLFMQDTFK